MAHEKAPNDKEPLLNPHTATLLKWGSGLAVVGTLVGLYISKASDASADQENGRSWYQVGATLEHYGFDGKVDPIGTPNVHKTKGTVDTITGQVGVEIPKCDSVTYNFEVHPDPTKGQHAVVFSQPLYRNAGGEPVEVYQKVTDPKALLEQAAAICAGQQAVHSTVPAS